LGIKNKIILHKTDLLDTELIFGNPNASNQARLKKAQSIKEIHGVFLYNHGRWGFGKYGSEETVILNELRNLIFPDFEAFGELKKRNALRDCLHLNTHREYKIDYFITSDKTILKYKGKLEQRYNIKVICPDKFVQLKEIQDLSNY
jgi:hypothetical protein